MQGTVVHPLIGTRCVLLCSELWKEFGQYLTSCFFVQNLNLRLVSSFVVC